MQSRRLLDASGAPCTAKMANALLRNVGRREGHLGRSGSLGDGGLDESASKKPKFTPGEVIDLT
jgi:hypothetical protein